VPPRSGCHHCAGACPFLCRSFGFKEYYSTIEVCNICEIWVAVPVCQRRVHFVLESAKLTGT
jgi:Fe-S-cluster-containing dehydrogenase component